MEQPDTKLSRRHRTVEFSHEKNVSFHLGTQLAHPQKGMAMMAHARCLLVFHCSKSNTRVGAYCSTKDQPGRSHSSSPQKRTLCRRELAIYPQGLPSLSMNIFRQYFAVWKWLTARGNSGRLPPQNRRGRIDENIHPVIFSRRLSPTRNHRSRKSGPD